MISNEVFRFATSIFLPNEIFLAAHIMQESKNKILSKMIAKIMYFPLQRARFIECLDLWSFPFLPQSNFRVGDQFYYQIKGVAMGSTCAPSGNGVYL